MNWDIIERLGLNRLQVRESILSKGPLDIRGGITNDTGPVEVRNSNFQLTGSEGDILLEDTGAGINFTRDFNNYIKLSGGTNSNLRIYDDVNGASLFQANVGGPVQVRAPTRFQVEGDGSSSSPAVQIGTGGAGLYVGAGEVYVVDEAGNATQLS